LFLLLSDTCKTEEELQHELISVTSYVIQKDKSGYTGCSFMITLVPYAADCLEKFPDGHDTTQLAQLSNGAAHGGSYRVP
jgi:hypothetical protein